MSNRRTPPALSPDDLETFHQALRDVTPIDSDRPAITAVPLDPVTYQHGTRPRISDAGRRANPRRTPDSTTPARLAEHDPGRVPGLDRRTALQLRRGEIGINARIDLHGMIQETAHRTLQQFIRDCYARDLRCVLVITGKGRRSGDHDVPFMSPEAGILRRMAPVWLSEAPVAGKVVAHSPAIPAHGGAGALYVLLRRRRKT